MARPTRASGRASERNWFRYWVEVFNSRNGFGSVFNRKTAEDKAIVEASTLQEWAKALTMHFDVTVEDCLVNPDDPPDGFAVVEGEKLSVKLAQLVTPEHIIRAKDGESPYSGELFKDAQWSRERLETGLNGLIAQKAQTYRKRGLRFDCLVIHSDEPWLQARDVLRWQDHLAINVQDVFERIYLLLDYDPAVSQEA